MKRVLLSVTATVLGIVALLSFKSHGHPITASGALPAAALPSTSASAGSPTTSAPTTSGAPPDPSPSSAASSSTPATVSSSATYTGAAEQTRYGIVQIKITVAGKKITNVAFAQLTAFDGHSAQINAQAAPILLQETLSAQSAQIDSVSGASYTSEGYVQSLQSALDQAGIP
jgi:uncharacterized protein with FMN-binding domain